MSVQEQCVNAGVPVAEAKRIEEAVKEFDSDDIRQRAIEELISAYHRNYPAVR